MLLLKTFHKEMKEILFMSSFFICIFSKKKRKITPFKIEKNILLKNLKSLNEKLIKKKEIAQ